MKKRWMYGLLWSLLLGSGSIAHTQKGLELGVVAIPQVTMMHDTTWWNAGPEIDYNILTVGIAGGLQGSINLTNNIGIGSGFLYSIQGQQFTTAKDWTVQDSAGGSFVVPQRFFGYRTTYYKIPFFLKLNTTIQSKTTFMFMAGVQMGLLQAATLYDNGAELNGATLFPRIEQDYKDRMADVDWSAMVAFDGRYNISKKFHASVLLRADYSLATIVNKDLVPDRNIRNITLGIQFGLHYVIGR